MNLTAVLLMLLPFSVLAQSGRLVGIVTEQSSGNRPVSGVEVSGSYANPVVTGIDGQYVLIFQDVEPGEGITVEARKNGWEVINREALQMQLPKAQVRPFKIVICPAGRLAENRKRFYQISDSTIIRRYNERLAALNRKASDWQQQAVQLDEERKRLEREARELANRFSQINFDDISPIQQQAFALFQAGKTGETIKLLETIDSRKDIAQAQTQKQKGRSLQETGQRIEANADSVIRQHIKKLLFQADLYKLTFQFDKAETVYELAVLADTTNLANVFTFANFLQAQNQHDKAIYWYQKALRLAKTDSDKARTLNNLGLLLRDKKDFRAAQTAFEQALAIRERLAKTNPAAHEPDVATTLNNLGILFSDKKDKDYAAAQTAYERALAIQERLAKTNPATYEPDVARTLTNLGLLLHEKNDFGVAQTVYERALAIRERLAKTDSATFEPALASTLNNLGNLLLDREDYGAAQTAYGRALTIHEKLTKTNPAAYEPDIAKTLNNLGLVLQAKNDFGAAQTAYERALTIRERLARINPVTYEPDIATTLTNLGILFSTKEDYETAQTVFNRVLTIYERLTKADPATYEPDVAKTLNNLGMLFIDRKNKDYGAAQTALERALAIYERFAKTAPDVYELEFCRSVVLLGIVVKQNYQNETATKVKSYLRQVESILTRYPRHPLAITLKKEVDNIAAYLKTYNIYKDIQAIKQQVGAAPNQAAKIQKQRLVVERYRQFITEGYPDLLWELGGAYGDLAWYLLFDRKFAEAEQVARQAISPANFIKPADYDKKIEWVHTNLALALLFQGKYIEAATIYRNFKDKPYNKVTYKETFLSDLNELEKAGITHPDVAKIRQMLQL